MSVVHLESPSNQVAALGERRHEGREFEASLGYILRPWSSCDGLNPSHWCMHCVCLDSFKIIKGWLVGFNSEIFR